MCRQGHFVSELARVPVIATIKLWKGLHRTIPCYYTVYTDYVRSLSHVIFRLCPPTLPNVKRSLHYYIYFTTTTYVGRNIYCLHYIATFCIVSCLVIYLSNFAFENFNFWLHLQNGSEKFIYYNFVILITNFRQVEKLKIGKEKEVY